MRKKYKTLSYFDYKDDRGVWRSVEKDSEFIITGIIKESKCNCRLRAIIEPHSKFPGLIGFDLGYIIKIPNRFKQWKN